MLHQQVGTARYGSNETINHSADGCPFTAASAKQHCRFFVAYRFGGETTTLASRRRSASEWYSSCAPVSNSIRMESQTTMSVSSALSTKMQTSVPVSRKIPPTPRCQSRSRPAIGSHFFQIASPAGTAKVPYLIKAHRFVRECTKRKINCIALGSQPVATHYFGARFIIDIYVGA